MINFTKDELECLHNSIDLQLKKIPMSEYNYLRREELLCKIQSMIDTYFECKHPAIISHNCGLTYDCSVCGHVNINLTKEMIEALNK